MSAIYRAHERANIILPEILSHEEYEKIRSFFRLSSGDQNPRTLSYMLSDRLTFGYTIGILKDSKVADELIQTLNAGQQELRDRVYDNAIRRPKQIETNSLIVPNLNITL